MGWLWPVPPLMGMLGLEGGSQLHLPPQTIACLAGGCSWDGAQPAACFAGELEVGDAMMGTGQGRVHQLGSR